jgi:death-on-curing protein
VSRKIQYLSLEEVIEISQALIPNFRIRDIGLLESAVNRPSTSIYGQEAYESFAEKVAALMHSQAANHASIDGNKRLTWASGRLFAMINDKDFKIGIDEAEQVIVGLASGQLDAKSLAPIINEWLKK